MPDEPKPSPDDPKPDAGPQGETPQGDVIIVGPRPQIHIEQGGDKDKEKGDEKGDDKKGGEDKKNGDKNGKEKKKFKWTPLRIILLIVVVVAVLIAAILYISYAMAHEETDDAYTTGYVHQISSRVTSNVVELDIMDNQFVHQGQVLLRLDPRDFQVEVAQTKANYDKAKADFDRVYALKQRRRHLQAGLRPDQGEHGGGEGAQLEKRAQPAELLHHRRADRRLHRQPHGQRRQPRHGGRRAHGRGAGHLGRGQLSRRRSSAR